MKRLENRLTSIAIAACALCIPASFCYATVEPELTTAIRHKAVQRVSTLLSEGVNVNERDEGAERTPLMWAAQTGSVSIVQSLLNHGASINAKDDFGATALDFALVQRNTQVAKLLASRGAKTGMGAKEARNSELIKKQTAKPEFAASNLPK